jgi:hypothetical protein
MKLLEHFSGQIDCFGPWISYGYQFEEVGAYEATNCSPGVYF